MDLYEHAYPIKDPNDTTLIVKKIVTPTNDVCIYTVNKDNKLQGLYRVYIKNTLVKEFEYKNNLLDGVCREWSAYTKCLKKVATYRGGLLHGNYAEYITINQIENGEKETYLIATTNCNYKNNVIHGESRHYDPHTGTIKSRYYIDGMLYVPPRATLAAGVKVK